jgi:DNA recombination protein RmuC
VIALTKELEARRREFEDQKKTLLQAQQQLTATFKATGAEALKSNSEQFLSLAKQTFETLLAQAKGDVEKKQLAIDELVKPMKEALDRQVAALTEMEKTRAQDRSSMQEQLRMIASAHEKLSGETSQLVKALRRPEQRGRWGELQLRNVVELAGMTRHCDFLEQMVIPGEDGNLRPDMLVKLPGEGLIVTDAKVALDAYFDAIEARDDETRRDALKRHARQFASHIDTLADKRYWDFATRIGKRTPQLVAMFVPLESALVAALEANPELHGEAMKRHVFIATPTLLVAMLRAIAYGWRQEDVAANAQKIAETGRQLYDRLSTFVSHFEKIGTALQRGNEAYNAAVGSLERTLLPAARRFRDLNATNAADLDPPRPIEIEVRPIVASELQMLPFVKPDDHADGDDGAAPELDEAPAPPPPVVTRPSPSWGSPSPSHLL